MRTDDYPRFWLLSFNMTEHPMMIIVCCIVWICICSCFAFKCTEKQHEGLNREIEDDSDLTSKQPPRPDEPDSPGVPGLLDGIQKPNENELHLEDRLDKLENHDRTTDLKLSRLEEQIKVLESLVETWRKASRVSNTRSTQYDLFTRSWNKAQGTRGERKRKDSMSPRRPILKSSSGTEIDTRIATLEHQMAALIQQAKIASRYLQQFHRTTRQLPIKQIYVYALGAGTFVPVDQALTYMSAGAMALYTPEMLAGVFFTPTLVKRASKSVARVADALYWPFFVLAFLGSADILMRLCLW